MGSEYGKYVAMRCNAPYRRLFRRIFLTLPGFAGCACLAQPSADFAKSLREAMRSSLQQQTLSVQKQAAAISAARPRADTSSASSFFSVPWPAPATGTAFTGKGVDCEAIPKPELEKLVQAASEREGLQADLVDAVIRKESAGRPCAVSPKGAQGLMQLMPATAMEMDVADPFDPKQNIDGGTRLLKQLLTKYKGDVALALGAYNAGSARVDRDAGVPQIPETVNYVADVLRQLSSPTK